MNQVTEKKNGALATFDMEADAQQGTQNISQEDLALPFLKILGQLSPEVNKRDGKYVEGAEPGKIINTVTNELFDKISVVPCHYKRQYIEWQDRGTSSGAPVAIHSADSDIVSQTTRGKDYKDRLPNGNYLDNTASHFVLTVGDNPSTAIITIKSTQHKITRKWIIKSYPAEDILFYEKESEKSYYYQYQPSQGGFLSREEMEQYVKGKKDALYGYSPKNKILQSSLFGLFIGLDFVFECDWYTLVCIEVACCGVYVIEVEWSGI